jgi:hypothetical protein
MQNAAAWLLVAATVLSLVSLGLFFVLLPSGQMSKPLVALLPILLGCVSMWLCWRARRAARHKIAVIVYAIVLAPFAFSYPAGLALLWATGLRVEFHRLSP